MDNDFDEWASSVSGTKKSKAKDNNNNFTFNYDNGG